MKFKLDENLSPSLAQMFVAAGHDAHSVVQQALGGQPHERVIDVCNREQRTLVTMSWLLFLDESGHDHKTCPYEVRGGIAIHASKLWPFVQALRGFQACLLASIIPRTVTKPDAFEVAEYLRKDR